MRGSRDEGCLSEGELEWQAADFFSREPSAREQASQIKYGHSQLGRARDPELMFKCF
jgi:hypothetical protein